MVGHKQKTISRFHLVCLLAVTKFNHKVHPTQEDRLPPPGFLFMMDNVDGVCSMGGASYLLFTQ